MTTICTDKTEVTSRESKEFTMQCTKRYGCAVSFLQDILLFDLTFLKFMTLRKTQTVMVGDLNCDFLSKTKTSYTNQLNDMLELFQIKQLITGPTRITETLWDIFMTNAPEKINNTGIVHLGISDHSLIYTWM